jgi:hypothetical protein
MPPLNDYKRAALGYAATGICTAIPLFIAADPGVAHRTVVFSDIGLAALTAFAFSAAAICWRAGSR